VTHLNLPSIDIFLTEAALIFLKLEANPII